MGQRLAGEQRAIVVDTVHQYNTGAIANPLPGYVDVWNVPQLIDVLRHVRGGSFRICYKPGYSLHAEFEAVARLALEVRNLTFAVDEIWNYCKPTWMPKPLEFMSRAWRHRGVTVLYTAQRPQLVCADLRENTTQWRLFRLAGSLALDAMRGRVPDAAISRLPQLPDYHHIWANDREQWRLMLPKNVHCKTISFTKSE